MYNFTMQMREYHLYVELHSAIESHLYVEFHHANDFLVLNKKSWRFGH